MWVLIMIIIILCALGEANPEKFGFVRAILSGAWSVIDAVGMFFVRIINKVANFIAFFVNIPTWFMGKVGILIAPLLDLLPDSPMVPLVTFLILGLLLLWLKPPGKGFDLSNMDKFAKLTYAWCFSAFNLGMLIAGSGNPLIWRSGALDTYVTEFPMTLLNIAEWTGFGRTMLTLTLIGGLIVSIIFGVTRGMRAFIRTWVGLGFCCMLGYGYMNIRLIVTDWLADNMGFIGGLLNIPIGFLEFFILIQFFLGIIVFVLPLGAIEAINDMGRVSRQRPSQGPSTKPAWDGDDFSTDSYPTYVTDDEGNNYSVSIDGDFLYINLPSGRISTKWEYVKGSSYFHVNGKRFYPHS